MKFEVGETVVYPHHGAATITQVKTRTIKGQDKLYLTLRVTQGDLVIEVPAENVDLVGVRDVIGREGLDAVFEVLKAPFTEEPTNWSRRYKANLEKLASGDVIKVSEVVRDLWRRDQDRGLSADDIAHTDEIDVVGGDLDGEITLRHTEFEVDLLFALDDPGLHFGDRRRSVVGVNDCLANLKKHEWMSFRDL